MTPSGARKVLSFRLEITTIVLVVMTATACYNEARLNDYAPAPSTLTMGFGLAAGQTPQAGIRQAASNIALEGLLSIGRDGRPQPWLADTWSTSPDGRTTSLRLKEGLMFHDGTPVTASAVRDILLKRLPQELGPSYHNILKIEAASDFAVEFHLKQRSGFIIESLGFPIQAPGPQPIGTGPFFLAESTADGVEMQANAKYHQGRPLLDRIVIRPYESFRSAWADMLRGRVDMLYEVGLDALGFLDSSSQARVFSFQRPYTYAVIFNVRRPSLRTAAMRRALNAAVDRAALVEEVLEGHGAPAESPVWPQHWARSTDAPTFRYEPALLATAENRIRLRCFFGDAALERMALAVQRQLQAVGVDLVLEYVSGETFFNRLQAGDFDTVLTDVISGPTLVRPDLFWRSGNTFNWGGFSSRAVDQALDTVRGAPDDETYKAGVAAFQRAIVDDPPAIFLAWSERARAVSTRFEVPVEPGRDILSTLRLWRPVAPATISNN